MSRPRQTYNYRDGYEIIPRDHAGSNRRWTVMAPPDEDGNRRVVSLPCTLADAREDVQFDRKDRP